MTATRSLLAPALVAALAAGAIAAPASAQRHWDWGGGPGDHRRYELAGRGVPMLDPELRRSRRGRAFVMRNFDVNHDGFISPREARAANRAFETIAGVDRADFDWDRYAAAPPPPPPPPLPPGRWDRGAMRAYHFRQTPEGARMTMQEDVLFRTDSAELRPHAIDKLRALADYLRDNPGVRVAIDGYCDSRGTRAHNQILSERRAESVRAAFDEMGVVRARFRVRGHGEDDPVASNATAAGRRLNRRVDITLLGRRASEFE